MTIPPIIFATSNPEKYKIAEVYCGQNDIPIEQLQLNDIPEIQGEDPRPIVLHKAQEAFKAYGKPVVVSDDSWNIPALNGFPGAYMKSINYWFKPADFLRLMHGIDDRTIVLEQFLVYIDQRETVLFEGQVAGQVVHEPRGVHEKSPIMSVVTLEGDDGKTIAEVFESHDSGNEHRFTGRKDAWKELSSWYKEKYS